MFSPVALSVTADKSVGGALGTKRGDEIIYASTYDNQSLGNLITPTFWSPRSGN